MSFAAVVCPTAANAQTATPAPIGSALPGVVGGTRPDLNVALTFAEAYDQDVSDRSGSIAPQMFQGSGSYTTLTPQLEFKQNHGRVQMGVTAGSSVRYYGDLHETVVTNYASGIGFNIQLTPQTSMFLNEGLTYSPALLYGLFNSTAAAPAVGDTVPAGSNYVLNMQRSYVYDSTASVTHKITGRMAVTVDGGFQYDDYTSGDTAYPDLRTKHVGSHLSYGLSRNLKLRLGYTWKDGQYIGAPKTTENALDIGIDYSRPLSRTRKTEFTFSFGPMLENGLLTSATSQDPKRQYRFIADTAVSHQLGRTWKVQGSYHRGMGYFVEGFERPVFSAAYGAAVTGYVSRRVDVSLSAAYSSGDSGLNAVQTQFTTYTGDARVRFGLNRILAFNVEYLFYYYKFDNGIPLPPDVPPYLTRNGVRTGLTMFVPVRHR